LKLTIKLKPVERRKVVSLSDKHIFRNRLLGCFPSADSWKTYKKAARGILEKKSVRHHKMGELLSSKTATSNTKPKLCSNG